MKENHHEHEEELHEYVIELTPEQITYALQPIVQPFVEANRQNIECTIYLARAQGYRAGVRSYSAQPGKQDTPSAAAREVFVEFPEKTIVWKCEDNGKEWLDTLPQYSD